MNVKKLILYFDNHVCCNIIVGFHPLKLATKIALFGFTVLLIIDPA